MYDKKLVGFEIKILANLIKRKIDAAMISRCTDNLTAMHGWIIGYIYKHGSESDIFQRDIESKFSIRRSTATGILQLMEKNDLIVRQPVDYDARLKKLVLTPKAVSMHEETTREIMKIEELLTQSLTKEEIEEFFIIAEKIKSSLL